MRYLVLSSLLCAALSAHAQVAQRPSPEEMLRVTDSATAANLATLERTTEAQLNAQLRVAERPETAERVASFKKNLFDALRKKGFTAEQAMQVVVSTPLPATGR
ncbi:MAG: hypothetical protein ACJ8HI_09780 [Massilia sp.]